MKETLFLHLKNARDVTISPFAFFRKISVKEGVRDAVYFLLMVYLLRGFGFYWQSYQQGYFMFPDIKVSPVFSVGVLILTIISPVLFMLILYVQALFVVRIGVFFGGIGNLEGSFKILGYAQFLSLMMFLPVLNIISRLAAYFVMMVGIREVFRVDWISCILTLFFSWLFTVILYFLVFVPPAFFAGMFAP